MAHGITTILLQRRFKAIRAGNQVLAAANITVSPTYIPHLVRACLDLMIDDANGVWHLANEGEISWYDWAKTSTMQCGLNVDLVVPEFESNAPAFRPQYSVLTSKKFSLMPKLQKAMDQYFDAKNALQLSSVQ